MSSLREKNLTVMNLSAIKVQKMARGLLSRLTINEKKHEEDWSAIMIQRCFRGYYLRRRWFLTLTLTLLSQEEVVCDGEEDIQRC